MYDARKSFNSIRQVAPVSTPNQYMMPSTRTSLPTNRHLDQFLYSLYPLILLVTNILHSPNA